MGRCGRGAFDSGDCPGGPAARHIDSDTWPQHTRVTLTQSHSVSLTHSLSDPQRVCRITLLLHLIRWRLMFDGSV